MKKWTKWDLLDILQFEVLSVSFIKADGSARTMRCTVKPDLCPPIKRTGKADSVHSDELVTVYDVDSDGWRSFYADTVFEVKYT